MTTTTSADLRAQLAALESEIPGLEATMAAGLKAAQRLRELQAGRYHEENGIRYGTISTLRAQLKAAEEAERRAAEDATARRAIIKEVGRTPYEWVVHSVTELYVTTRRKGEWSMTVKFDATTGECSSKWVKSTLDIAATFPEGIAAYRKAAKAAKVKP